MRKEGIYERHVTQQTPHRSWYYIYKSIPRWRQKSFISANNPPSPQNVSRMRLCFNTSMTAKLLASIISPSKMCAAKILLHVQMYLRILLNSLPLLSNHLLPRFSTPPTQELRSRPKQFQSTVAMNQNLKSRLEGIFNNDINLCPLRPLVGPT